VCTGWGWVPGSGVVAVGCRGRRWVWQVGGWSMVGGRGVLSGIDGGGCLIPLVRSVVTGVGP
jgi:hypothetical protein